MPRKSKEFQNFDNTMTKLLAVPHDELKAKLDAEKKAKQKPKPDSSKRSIRHGRKRDEENQT